MLCAMTSSAAQPNMCSPAVLSESTTPSSLTVRIPSAAVLTMARIRASLQASYQRPANTDEEFRASRHERQADASRDEAGTEKRRANFHQIDLGYDAPIQLRHRFVRREHPYPPVVESDEGTGPSQQRAPHGFT